MDDADLIARSHICACSTNLEKTKEFGIAQENVFGFWDFVGGRFSVWSCIGVLPLSIHFGYDVITEFLRGGHYIDENFCSGLNEVHLSISLEKYSFDAWINWIFQNFYSRLFS